jgi:radical SAM superfamily enzyme YgiQ (UPF0313 family)
LHLADGSRPQALFINPPIYDFALYDLHLKPYALLRLAAWFEKAGYEVVFFDYLDHTDPQSCAVLGRPRRRPDGTGKFLRDTRLSKPSALSDVPRRYARYGILRDSAERQLAAFRPDIVLLSTTMTYWYPGLAEAVRTARRLFGSTPIMVGGPYVSLCPQHARSYVEADHHITGDAWRAVPRILESLGLPTPREHPPEELLLSAQVLRESAPLRLNRGCPLHCDYCASPVLCPRFEPGEPDETFRVMNEIVDTLNIRTFAFYDDALLAGKEQALKPFLERVVDETTGVRFATPNALHLALLDEEVAVLMQRAGFSEIRLGYESASASFHALYDRKVSPGMLRDAVTALRSAGFAGEQITAYVLAGLPQQSATEVRDSVRAVQRERIRVSVAEFSPVPFTPLWRRCVEQSRYPLGEEPLFHNNTVMPMEWEGLTRQDLAAIRQAARDASAAAV